MSMSAEKYSFSPEEVAELKSVYQSALNDMRGRPEWRRRLGPAKIRDIAARTIMAAATAGIRAPDVLQDMAVKAVTVHVYRSTH